MNKTNSICKRNMGRPQPKRPKLDICTNLSLPTSSEIKDPLNSCVSSKKNLTNLGMQKAQTGMSTSYWDDEDFSSDMLEKVCLIADLSQAMVSNEPQMKEISSTVNKQEYMGNVSEQCRNDSEVLNDIEKLKYENESLIENIKTKEGEVQILRSQLKQNQEAKQTETLNNIRLMEEMQSSYKEKIEGLQKELAAAKTELQFKELELKSVMEKYQHLDGSTSKIRLVEPQVAQLESKKSFFNTSQVVTKKMNVETVGDHNLNEQPITFKYPLLLIHEGQKFSKLICPDYFNDSKDGNIIFLYKFNRDCGYHVSSLDFDKREKYKWSGLPKQSVFLKDTYTSVSKLFLYENFSIKGAMDIIENLLSISMQILNFQRDLLVFLEQLQEKNSEFDDSDYTLLENEDDVKLITIKELLNGERINKEECGVESRRILAMIVSLIQSSKSVLQFFIDNTNFIVLLKDVTTSIGNLRRPTRYAGILASITLLLIQFLGNSGLEQKFISVLHEIIKEVIFARPKLDVLSLVVTALAAGKDHKDFVQGLCRKGSVESCALYMDSKLHQAMFFTKDACPLKLLCTQIMGLSCVSSKCEIKWYVTREIVNWLNRSMDVPFSGHIKWLPCASSSESDEKCFDVTECLVYLLNSCLKDFILNFDNWSENYETIINSIEMENTQFNLISIIGDGCLLLQRILKPDQRLLHENSHNLRFGTLLKSLKRYHGLNSHQIEALKWIIELMESELKNQEGCAKQTSSNFSDKDIIDALKINEDLIVF